MNNSKRKHIILLVLVLVFSANTLAGVQIGDIPYESLGKTVDSKEVLVKNFKGKVVVITFWATWCPPCMKEIPVLSGIQKKVGTDELQVIAVNFKEKKKMFRSIADALQDNPMIITYDRNSKVAKKYGVKAIPHMFIVGRDGKVAATHVGYSADSLPGLVEEINALLAQ